jgi:hypothetical protein
LTARPTQGRDRTVILKVESIKGELPS